MRAIAVPTAPRRTNGRRPTFSISPLKAMTTGTGMTIAIVVNTSAVLVEIPADLTR